MRNILLSLVVLAGLAGAAYSACLGPYCYDDTGAGIKGNVSIEGTITNNAPQSMYSRTLTQLLTTTPTGAGQLIYCSDCTRSLVCISTGTGQGAWSILVSTASGVLSAATSVDCI